MQKTTIKLLLNKNKQNKKGYHPIYIRITVDRRSSYISTGYHVASNEWDEKYECVKNINPFYSSINKDIIKKKKEVLDNLVNAFKDSNISAASVKEVTVMGSERTNIFSFCDRYRDGMKDKRGKGTVENWGKHLKKLENFHGSRTLYFDQVTTEYINKFEKYLRNGGIKKRKNPDNYIVAIMRSIRKIINAAISQKLTDNYPFENYEWPEYTPGNKDRLTLAELDKLEKYVQTTTNKRNRQVAVWFLFACYTGLRISDCYAFNMDTDIHDGYFSLTAIKNNGRIAMPIHDRLKRVIAWAKETPRPQRRGNISDQIKVICKELKIKKMPSSHSGRCTFAITLCAERGISVETCAKLLGISVEVCLENYYRITPHKVKGETSVAWSNL